MPAEFLPAAGDGARALGSGVILAVGLNSDTTPNSTTATTTDHILELVAAAYKTLVADGAVSALPAPHHLTSHDALTRRCTSPGQALPSASDAARV